MSVNMIKRNQDLNVVDIYLNQLEQNYHLHKKHMKIERNVLQLQKVNNVLNILDLQQEKLGIDNG